MRKARALLAGILVVGLGGGLLNAQPAGGDALPDVNLPGQTTANLSPREMATETKKLLTAMEGFHVRVLQLQSSARKSKDVIKLNCVNEKLLAVKQLLNIAESAENDLTEAIASGDRDAQVHQYSQVKLAHERATSERDEAEGCIGEEIIFIGPTQVTTDGPPIPDDPTADPHDPFGGTVVDIEHVGWATPIGADL
jgi:hypothetical protein